MAILKHILSGAGRSARAWKWILISWIITLLMVALIVYPFRKGITSILGLSMITEKLRSGLDIDVFMNSGTGFPEMASILSSGIIILIITTFLVNIFLSGGFFSVLGRKSESMGQVTFFGASGSNFWSFFVITFLMRLVLNIISFLIIGLPLIIMTGGGSSADIPGILIVTGSIFCAVLPVLLLVADYARAWQASTIKKDAIRALGHGFRYTFRYFFSSWLMMFLIVAVQVLFTAFTFAVITRLKPDTGTGIFLMFLLSQIMFIVKIYLRTWRFGMITSKFEAHS